MPLFSGQYNVGVVKQGGGIVIHVSHASVLKIDDPDASVALHHDIPAVVVSVDEHTRKADEIIDNGLDEFQKVRFYAFSRLFCIQLFKSPEGEKIHLPHELFKIERVLCCECPGIETLCSPHLYCDDLVYGLIVDSSGLFRKTAYSHYILKGCVAAVFQQKQVRLGNVKVNVGDRNPRHRQISVDVEKGKLPLHDVGAGVPHKYHRDGSTATIASSFEDNPVVRSRGSITPEPENVFDRGRVFEGLAEQFLEF